MNITVRKVPHLTRLTCLCANYVPIFTTHPIDYTLLGLLIERNNMFGHLMRLSRCCGNFYTSVGYCRVFCFIRYSFIWSNPHAIGRAHLLKINRPTCRATFCALMNIRTLRLLPLTKTDRGRRWTYRVPRTSSLVVLSQKSEYGFSCQSEVELYRWSSPVCGNPPIVISSMPTEELFLNESLHHLD
jgi:hypothetical protein